MGKTTGKPLSALRLKSMKEGETVSDVAENRGLRVSRTSAGWRYWYRYRQPGNDKQRELTLFTRDAAALAEARLLFADLKAQSRRGAEIAART